MKFSKINKGDIVYESCKYARLTIEIKVLTQPESEEIESFGNKKALRWSFKGQTAKGKIGFMETEGCEHYGPRLSDYPEYSFPVLKLDGTKEEFDYQF